MKVRNYMETSLKGLVILCMALGLAACSLEEDAGAGTDIAGISWTAPKERSDGDPLLMSEIAGYWVYYGTTEGDYPDRINIDDSGKMQGTVTAASGTYYVVVTTYDTEGRESAFSSPALEIRI